MNPLKVKLARAFEVSRLSRTLLRAQRVLAGPHIRAINYHDVTASDADGFERQLAFYRRHFVPVALEDLDALVQGRWAHDRPGLIISFDDGLRSHAEIAAPLLERHGFVGWFMVPVGFVETPPSHQVSFARHRNITARQTYDDGCIAMSWDQMRTLAKRHVIGCHTRDHTRLRANLSESELRTEIVDTKACLESELGKPVDVFAWVGGEEDTYSASAAKVIREAGYRYSFMTNNALFQPDDSALHIQRTNVEADWPMAVTQFQLSGFMDLMYTAKRRRVRHLTA